MHKPYTDLTLVGQLRRLRDLAVAALGCYDLDRPELVYHGFDTNLLYRVATASGERFMLRLAVPSWRTFEDLRSEAMWLGALARDTQVPAPRIVPARTGEHVLPISHPGIPDTWHVSLMSWVPGRLLGRYLTERNLEKMGALFAELHHHGATWTPPAGFTTRRFEHWLSRGEQNLIIDGAQAAGTGSEPAGLAGLPAGARDVLERMHRHVEAAYAAIDRADLRVIHCDLWHDNIKLYHGMLQPIDFEDTVWGFRVHDIAMAMLDLLEDTDDVRYAALLPAFRRGYAAHLAWPDDPIEPFQIGRLLWKINWVAYCQPQWLGSMVERHVPVFEQYERTGTVVRPPAG
ncbi:MAG: phosphotransferase [Anaerolineae bacterium]|nr:phosphotransferase [Anaerolineae bacterium]